MLAGTFCLFGPGFASGTLGNLVTALFYLFFITVVWVLLWDPIERLLFDAYLLRSRIAALTKLGRASSRFVAAPSSPGR